MKRALLVLSVLAGTFAFLTRLVTYSGGFSNDHFVHLSRAQAMLTGDLPLRDYTEEGVPLTVVLSAGSQLLLGEGPFAELVLTLISLSIAAAATCYATGRLTNSPVLGVFAALLQIAAYPRLYSHPKLVLYPVLFLLGWAYVRRPEVRRLVALGVLTAIAFLLRHDHGVYCAVGSGVAIALAHGPEGARPLMRRAAVLAGIGLLCVSPYLAYVQVERGLGDYLRVGMAISRGEADRADFSWPEVQSIRRGALVRIRPRMRGTLAPIAVRWRDDVSEEERHRYELGLDLRYAQRPEGGGTLWRYWIDPRATDTLQRLTQLPEAAGTEGFDHASLRLDHEPSWIRRIAGTLGLDRLQPGPPIEDLFSEANSVTIMFSALWLLPLSALTWWAFRRRRPPPTFACGPEILLLSAITIVTTLFLVREPSRYRVADGFGTAPILGVWLMASVFHVPIQSALLRRAMKIAVLVMAAVVITATSVMGQIGDRLNSTGMLEGPGEVVTRVRNIVQDMRTWPWRGAWPQGDGIVLVPYLNRCTNEGDRLLVLWNAPEFNVFSRRPFAGGETLLVPVFRPPATYEQSVLARLQRQRVPIVLSDPDQVGAFGDAYPRIAEYLSMRYREAGVVAVSGQQRIGVSVDRARTPSGIDPQFSLPCFSDRGPD